MYNFVHNTVYPCKRLFTCEAFLLPSLNYVNYEIGLYLSYSLITEMHVSSHVFLRFNDLHSCVCLVQFQILDHLGKSSDTDSSSPVEYLLSKSRLLNQSQSPVSFLCYIFYNLSFVDLAAGRL